MFKLDRELSGGTSSQTSQPMRARPAERYIKAKGFIERIEAR